MCRTPTLGGTLIRCIKCDHKRYQYLSCGHSQCPICQGIKRVQWEDRLSGRMLKVPYCHVTFTLPHEINGMARRNPHAVYNLLMRSAWKTIKKLISDKDEAGGLPGMSCVLHTWGSDLKYHVHVHCLVTFGGLATQGKKEWVWPKRRNKLASYRRMSGNFRACFLRDLEAVMNHKAFVYHRSFEDVRNEMMRKRWVVHNTQPVTDTRILEEYLSRYICRIGISNSSGRTESNTGVGSIACHTPLDAARITSLLPAQPALRTTCRLNLQEIPPTHSLTSQAKRAFHTNTFPNT